MTVQNTLSFLVQSLEGGRNIVVHKWVQFILVHKWVQIILVHKWVQNTLNDLPEGRKHFGGNDSF